MLYTVEISQVNLVAGQDLLFGQTWRISDRARMLERIALTGGDPTGAPVTGQAGVDLFIGDQRIGIHYSSGTGAPAYLEDLFPIMEMVRAGAPIVANVIKIPQSGTDPTYLMLQLSNR